jgi:hypothetical protein
MVLAVASWRTPHHQFYRCVRQSFSLRKEGEAFAVMCEATVPPT